MSLFHGPGDRETGTSMLLRRITKHVKDQNWFAVGLDFVIVVVGILIAFQITNWSEARQDRVDERVVLERLEEDFEQILDRADNSLANHKRNLEAAGRLILGIRNQTFEEETLLDDVGAASNFSTAPGPSATFTQLMSSGRLELIPDQELRRTLTEYHAYLDFSQRLYGPTFAEPLVEARQTLLKATVLKVTNVPTTEFDQGEPPEDLDRTMLLTDPEMMATLQVCYEIQDNIYLVNYRTRGQVLAILDQIRAEQEKAR